MMKGNNFTKQVVLTLICTVLFSLSVAAKKN